MRRLAPHLAAVAGVVAMSYVAGRAEDALRAHHAQTFQIQWHLHVLISALYVIQGVLLAAPRWWGRRLPAPDWATMGLYVLPGLLLANVMVICFLPVRLIPSGWGEALLSGGIRHAGGILAGCGLVRACTRGMA